MRLIYAIIFVCAQIVPTSAFANESFNSIAAGVESLSANARVGLKSGRYAYDNGRSRVIWVLEADRRANLEIKYAFGGIERGVIDFGNSPTSVIVRSQNLCTKIVVKKIAVTFGGAIDEANSNFYLDKPGPDCEIPRSQMMGALEDALSLTDDPTKMMLGEPFIARNGFRRCKNNACTGSYSSMEPDNPVYEIRLFPNSETETKGFELDFADGATLELPNSAGFVKMEHGSSVRVRNAYYNTLQERGDAVLENFSMNVRAGQLVFGNTVLFLERGSSFDLDGFRIESEEGRTTATNGSFSGRLGSNSSIELANDDRTGKSNIILASAEATLSGLNIVIDEDDAVLSGSSGNLSVTASSADLNFSENQRLLLGSTSLAIVLACPAGEGSDCVPFEWKRSGETQVVGQIPSLGTSIRTGRFQLPNQNFLDIESGEFIATSLNIDTRDETTPITGSFSKFDVKLSTTNWKIDDSTAVEGALFRVTSQDLGFESGDPYPTGSIVFTGTVNKLSARGVGDFRLTSDSSFTISASRVREDEVKITDGNVDGNIVLRASTAESSASGRAKLRLENLQYYREYGSASLSFSVEELAASHKVSEPDQRDGWTGGETRVSFTDRTLQATQATPLKFDNVEVEFNNGVWVAPKIDLPFSFNLAVATGELVYINVRVGNPSIGLPYKTVCAPKVNINTGSYVVAGNLGLELTKDGGRYSATFNSLSPRFDVDVDDRGCDLIAKAICGVVGSMGGGLTATALAIACGKELESKKEEFQNKMADEVDKAIQSLKFEATF